MKTRILFFLMNGAGGAERITITISNFFDDRDFDVKYVLVQKGDDRILQFMRPEIPVIRVPVKRIYFSTLLIYRLLKREKPDIVFCASPAINARLIVAAKMVGGIRIVVRNSNMFNFERKDVQWLMQHTYKWADRIILQQEQMREDLHHNIPYLPRKKTITLHNPIDEVHINEGINSPSPYPVTEKCVNYLWVARFANEKAQDILVRAFEIVHKGNPCAHLWLVGKYNSNSDFVSAIVSFLKERNIVNAVHFVGHDVNPYKWMKYCDCFVLPSRFEGLPNALIEAMYLGRPVVATRCLDIITEMVKDGENGYTCEVGDIEMMAKQMERAILLKNCTMSYRPASRDDFINTILNN